jgi:hypothetical protein
MRPRISVVIPGRNDAAALRETLEALDRLAGREEAGYFSPPRVTPRPSRRLWAAASTRAALLSAGAFAACGDILILPARRLHAAGEHLRADRPTSTWSWMIPRCSRCSLRNRSSRPLPLLSASISCGSGAGRGALTFAVRQPREGNPGEKMPPTRSNVRGALYLEGPREPGRLERTSRPPAPGASRVLRARLTPGQDELKHSLPGRFV